MKFLFVDNFRKFSDAYFEFEKINFCVGENSCGKTSILSLLHLLYSNEFWIDFEFENRHINLSSFAKLTKNVNKNFSVGGVFEVNDEDERLQIKFKLSFKNYNDTPKLIKAMVEYDNYLVEYKVEHKKSEREVSYKSAKIDVSYIDTMENFKEWLSKSIFNKSKRFTKQKNTKSKPLGYILEIIFNSCSEESKYGLDFTDNPTTFWEGPLRAPPKEIYFFNKPSFSPDGKHAPSLFNVFFNKRLDYKSNTLYKIMENFGKESGLFDEIIINKFTNKSTHPFEICILKDNEQYNISSVGYGVSQILPLIGDMIFGANNAVFFLQQPEVHLHPKAQASFGEFLFNIHLANKDKTFFIETHSDYLIDRFRYLQSTSKEKTNSAKIIYFEPVEQKNVHYEINIGTHGSLENPPKNYKNFFISETMRMLEIE